MTDQHPAMPDDMKVRHGFNPTDELQQAANRLYYGREYIPDGVDDTDASIWRIVVTAGVAYAALVIATKDELRPMAWGAAHLPKKPDIAAARALATRLREMADDIEQLAIAETGS